MMKPLLGSGIYGFLSAMHRYDAGRTLPILHAAKLTTPQLAALEFARESRTVSTIANHLGLSRPAASQLIDKLVRGGLVRRVEGTLDRRQRNVILSAKGRALTGRIAAARAARFDASLAALAPDLAARFASILDEVIGALAAAPPAAGPTSPSKQKDR
jgi:DNA-binding MarR family transcriptional regulator